MLAFFYLLLVAVVAVALQAQSPAHKAMSGESGPETRKRYPVYQAPGLVVRQGETQVILPRQPVYCGAVSFSSSTTETCRSLWPTIHLRKGTRPGGLRTEEKHGWTPAPALP